MQKGKAGISNLKAAGLPGSVGLRRWVPSLVLLPLCLYVLARQGEAQPIGTLNLFVHEGGHLIFSAFGEFLHAAGGTLMQLLLPAMLAVVCWRCSLPRSTQVSLMWLGQSTLELSVYAGDARLQGLELIGGDRHDWHYLLGSTGLLEYDQGIAFFFFFCAVLCFLTMLALPVYQRKRRSVKR